jgi:hypothetical protein
MKYCIKKGSKNALCPRGRVWILFLVSLSGYPFNTSVTPQTERLRAYSMKTLYTPLLTKVVIRASVLRSNMCVQSSCDCSAFECTLPGAIGRPQSCQVSRFVFMLCLVLLNAFKCPFKFSGQSLHGPPSAVCCIHMLSGAVVYLHTLNQVLWIIFIRSVKFREPRLCS